MLTVSALALPSAARAQAAARAAAPAPAAPAPAPRPSPATESGATQGPTQGLSRRAMLSVALMYASPASSAHAASLEREVKKTAKQASKTVKKASKESSKALVKGAKSTVKQARSVGRSGKYLADKAIKGDGPLGIKGAARDATYRVNQALDR